MKGWVQGWIIVSITGVLTAARRRNAGTTEREMPAFNEKRRRRFDGYSRRIGGDPTAESYSQSPAVKRRRLLTQSAVVTLAFFAADPTVVLPAFRRWIAGCLLSG